jgi:hypothetical protein
MFLTPTSSKANAKDYANYFFRKVDGEEKSWSCNFCEKILSKDNGYSNLVSHLNKQHPDYIKIYDVQQAGKAEGVSTLDKVWLVTEDAKKIHFWMRKVVLLPAPFSYVENPIAREVVSFYLFNYSVKHIKLSKSILHYTGSAIQGNLNRNPEEIHYRCRIVYYSQDYQARTRES